jgi:type I restriction-modification system DNA methylase subunit
MAGILSFDSRKFNHILDKYGLEKTWFKILATKLSKNDEFSYVLKHPNFKNVVPFDEDIIDELSIGEIGVLYEYSLARLNTDKRKDNGQFFTPDDIAEVMTERAKLFPDGKWLDPCSGIGNLSWHLTNMQDDKEEFLKRKLILSDTDELALFIARVLFTISFQKNDKNLFNNIENSFVVFDFLSVADKGESTLFSDDKEQLTKIPAHDFVIVNPPYLATNVDNRFETEKCADLYAYFLENIIKTSKGFISVTPQSFTNAAKFYSLRKLLLDNYSNLTIYNFDNVPDNLFHGIKFGSKNTNKANSIRAAITVALPGSGKHRITSLLRWQTKERKELLSSIDLFLSEACLTPKFFPKVNKVFEPVFQEIKGNKTLSSLINTKKTAYPLFIPSSPRYFIPALKSPVMRASIKTIYFNSAKDREFAYMLINSSLMYWWWRVRDGGMTLSLETIESLPLVDFEVDDAVVSKLAKSETENRVYKTNAGAIQENVKHPKAVLNGVNLCVFPKYSDRLLSVHENSELKQLKFIA